MIDRRFMFGQVLAAERCPLCGAACVAPAPCDECVLGDLARPDGFKKGDGGGGGLGDLKPEG